MSGFSLNKIWNQFRTQKHKYIDKRESKSKSKSVRFSHLDVHLYEPPSRSYSPKTPNSIEQKRKQKAYESDLKKYKNKTCKHNLWDFYNVYDSDFDDESYENMDDKTKQDMKHEIAKKMKPSDFPCVKKNTIFYDPNELSDEFIRIIDERDKMKKSSTQYPNSKSRRQHYIEIENRLKANGQKFRRYSPNK
jgi:hypothetical protein